MKINDVSRRIWSMLLRYRLLWVVAAVVLLIAIALPDTGSGAVIMAPFASDEFGIRGVTPQNWTDQAALIQQSVPATRDQASSVLLAQTSLTEIPQSSGRYAGAALTWDLYTFDTQIKDLGSETYRVHLALAERDSVTYVVAMVALPIDYVANAPMLETAFLHALYGLAPLE